jgi:hypothetical protein
MASNVYLSEWVGSTFDDYKTFEICILAAFAICLTRGVRVPLSRLVLILAIFSQTLHHQRLTVICVMVTALLLAEPIGRTLSGAKAEFSAAALSVGLAALLVLVAIRTATPRPITDTPLTPITALGQVPREIAYRPGFTQFELGGFLVLRGIRPFIDGRADLYGEKFVSEYFEAIKSREGVSAIIDRYKLVWATFQAGHPVNQYLRDIGWQPLHSDPYAVVLVRPTY